MSPVNEKHDDGQFQRPFRLAAMEVAMVTKLTMVIELTGINMAAIMGDNCACTAKLNPTKL